MARQDIRATNSATSPPRRRRGKRALLSRPLEHHDSDRELLARFAGGDEEALARVFERHRPWLRRHAGRLLRGSGHDPDDILQDVFLRVHGALRGGVAPLAPRAWLLRLVQNACIDELRSGRRMAGEAVELDLLPSTGAHPPVELARRIEARALLVDMSRLPDRQRDVLVLSALDGLSHEEVATRLDTTVVTTRSLLARARENLRRTAAARDTACASVREDLQQAVDARVRPSEVARRHLWSCADCRAHARDLRPARRRRRLAAWSPVGVLVQLITSGGAQKVAVGVCCALMLDGAATVPGIVGGVTPEIAQVAAEPPVAAAAKPKRPRHQAVKKRRANVVLAAATPVPASTPMPTAAATPKPAAKKPRKTPIARAALNANLARALHTIVGDFERGTPTADTQAAMKRAVADFRAAHDLNARLAALRRAFKLRGPLHPAAPHKGVMRPTPTPVATATPAAASG